LPQSDPLDSFGIVSLDTHMQCHWNLPTHAKFLHLNEYP
jgi:hypothetical protein